MLQEAAAAVGQMYVSAIQELKALNIDSFLTISLTPIKRASRDRDANASDSYSQDFVENLDAAENGKYPFHTVQPGPVSSYFLFSLLLPWLLPCPALPLPTPPLTRPWHAT